MEAFFQKKVPDRTSSAIVLCKIVQKAMGGIYFFFFTHKTRVAKIFTTFHHSGKVDGNL